MAFDNVPHGFPKELWKDVRQELEELVRDGLVVEKPAGYGLQVSLNVGKKAEIEEIIFSGD